MIKFLVLLGFLCFCIKTGSGQFLSNENSENNSTFDFNKTIENIIASLHNAEELNKVLDQIVELQKPVNQAATSKLIPVADIANITIGTASLAVATAALGIQAAQFEIDTQKNIKDANDQEIRDLENDTHYAKLKEQNEKIMKSLENINNGIEDAASHISERINRDRFTEKILARMFIVFRRFELMKIIPSEEHRERFKEICGKNDPFDIVFDMRTYTDSIFINKNTEIYDQNQFFNFVLMYLNLMNQFYILQPHCSKLVFPSTTPESMNITLMEGKRMVDKSLKNKDINNMMIFK